MSNYAVAQQILPLRMLAAQPFTVGWALAVEDGTALGAPLDMTSVTDATVSATQRLARGLTPPAATVWTISNSGGITLTTVVVGGVSYPYMQLQAAAAPAAGVYDVTVTLTGAGGAIDWLLNAVFEVSAA